MTTEIPRWIKSSYSDNGGDCVEAAVNLAGPFGLVPVRDSKHAHSPVLAFPTPAWSTFVNFLKH
ncbi:DUF397 domain-containing protein [Streptomyces xiamenensis]|uniref:DUF397 domain-containing protein n=1 Tax=Streptomyces xiamenensis TaxID=408015 RepID=UPI0036E5CB13